MAINSIVAFWVVAALLIAVPGADWAFVLDAAARSRAVIPAVSGLVIGYTGITLMVAAGVGAVVAGSTTALTGLTFVGGAYLTWHGVMTFRHPSTPPTHLGIHRDTAASATQGTSVTSRTLADRAAGSGGSAVAQGAGPASTRSDVLVRGIGVSGLNPKGLLIFLALLPQFVRPRESLPIAAQIGVLGLAFIVTVAIFYLILGTFARTVLHARPSAARVISRISGAGMVVVGLILIIARVTVYL
jgi:threonine/homoserine/homoserine lactone efflux protein